MKIRHVLALGVLGCAGAICATGFPRRIGLTRSEAAVSLPGDLELPNADVVVVVEDGLVDGGIGSQLRDAVEEYQAAHGATGGSPVFRRIGIPRRFIDTATRDQLLEDFGMRAADIAQAARSAADGVAGPRADQDLRSE